MTDRWIDLLRNQAQTLQGLELSEDEAAELAPIVRQLNDEVARTIAGHPYDVDATSFFAALHRYRDSEDGE